jgi:hypothetical protein
LHNPQVYQQFIETLTLEPIKNFNDEVKYGDGKSLAFDGKGVPYIFPFIQHVHDNKTYERCVEMSGKDFAANLK